MPTLRIVLIVLVVLLLLGGGLGISSYGPWAVSPGMLLLLVLVALIVAGVI